MKRYINSSTEKERQKWKEELKDRGYKYITVEYARGVDTFYDEEKYVKEVVYEVIPECTTQELAHPYNWVITFTSSKAEEYIDIHIPCSIWTYKAEAKVDTGDNTYEVSVSFSGDANRVGYDW